MAMNMMHIRNVLSFAVVMLSVALAVSACGSDCSPLDQACSVDALSEHYKQDRDYESLALLLPSLNVHSMARADVEGLLGEPTYCPTSEICYYPSDKMVIMTCGEGSEPQGETCVVSSTGQEIPPLRFPLILVVRYNLMAGRILPEASDRLSGFWLGPVGE